MTGANNYVTSTSYDAAGRIDVRTFGNYTQTDYDYHPWTAQGGRLKYLKSGTSGNTTSLQSLEYAYATRNIRIGLSFLPTIYIAILNLENGTVAYLHGYTLVDWGIVES